jgi:hypothetical protein
LATAKPAAPANTLANTLPADHPRAPDPVDAVREEAALLQTAHAALARGDIATAGAKLDEHAARFPRGALSAEREAARVHLLCASGRSADARAAASAFVAANPRSPLAPSVKSSCATTP